MAEWVRANSNPINARSCVEQKHRPGGEEQRMQNRERTGAEICGVRAAAHPESIYDQSIHLLIRCAEWVNERTKERFEAISGAPLWIEIERGAVSMQPVQSTRTMGCLSWGVWQIARHFVKENRVWNMLGASVSRAHWELPLCLQCYCTSEVININCLPLTGERHAYISPALIILFRRC